MTPPKNPVLGRVVVIPDPHLSYDRPPGTRSPKEYQNETESLFAQVLDIATLTKADHVCCVGDWFHSKGNTTHMTVGWAVALLKPIVDKFGPVITCFGNHDMTGNDAVSVLSQPLGVLLRAGLIDPGPVQGHDTEKGYTIFVTHYGQQYRAQRRISGRYAYCPAVCLMHGEEADAASAQTRVHEHCLVVNGHIHCPASCGDYGPVNLGCLTRVSRVEADWVPRVAVVTFRANERPTYKLISLALTVPGAAAFVAEQENAGEVAFGDELARTQFAKELATGGDRLDPVNMLAKYVAKNDVDPGVAKLARRLIEEAV